MYFNWVFPFPQCSYLFCLLPTNPTNFVYPLSISHLSHMKINGNNRNQNKQKTLPKTKQSWHTKISESHFYWFSIFQQIPIASGPWQRVEVCAFLLPCRSLVWLKPVPALHVPSQISLSSNVMFGRICFLKSCTTSGSYYIFTSSPNSWRNDLTKTFHLGLSSPGSHSVQIVQIVGFCVNCHLLQEEAFLMRVDWCSDLQV